MNLFEIASRSKLRFDAGKTSVTTEQLWDLPLTQLDTIAVALYNATTTANTTSFIAGGKKTAETAENELKFLVVKHIIDTLLKEKEDKTARAEKAARRKFLREVIADKQRQATLDTSLSDLQAELDSLGD